MVVDFDDFRCAFLLLCATFGLGSLTMAYVYAQAGPIYGSFVLYFVSFCNLYSSLLLSEVLLAVPSYVNTYGDVAYYLYGSGWKWIAIMAQAGTCIMTPIAFLILGGKTLLPVVFEDIASDLVTQEWILIMAVVILPFIYIPTLRETTHVAIVGFGGTVIAVLVALIITLTTKDFDEKESDPTFRGVLNTYGTITFAFGTACLVPSIQRVHHNPKRMRSVLALTLLFITAVYASIGLAGYYQFGCTSPHNILFQMPEGVYRRAAYTFMLIHVTIAYVVILNPTLYVVERALFSHFNQHEEETSESIEGKPILSDSILTHDHRDIDPFEDSNVGTKAAEIDNMERIISIILRTGIVIGQVVLALLLLDSLSHVLEFIGATSVTISCSVAPCVLYLKMFGKEISLITRMLIYFIIVSNVLCGSYVTFSSLEGIIHAFEQAHYGAGNFTTVKYPFCKPGERQ